MNSLMYPTKVIAGVLKGKTVGLIPPFSWSNHVDIEYFERGMLVRDSISRLDLDGVPFLKDRIISPDPAPSF